MARHHRGFIALDLVGEDHCRLFYNPVTQLSRQVIRITLMDRQLVCHLLI